MLSQYLSHKILVPKPWSQNSSHKSLVTTVSITFVTITTASITTVTINTITITITITVSQKQ